MTVLPEGSRQGERFLSSPGSVIGKPQVVMKAIGSLTKGLSFLFVVGSFVSTTFAAGPDRPARATVHAVRGEAMFLSGGKWKPLHENTTLLAGADLKTGPDSSVDLFMMDSSTVLRVMSDSELRFDRLEELPGADRVVTTTRLTLISGTLIGSQRKLPTASEFVIRTAKGVARIVGTEYVVRADGAVSVLSGQVGINWNLPGNGGSVMVDVPQGFSFDPATGQVVPTTSDYLQNLIADIKTVQNNAQTFKIGRANLVVNPEHMSPVHPGDDNGQGDDNNNQGNENGNGNSQGNQN